MNRNKILFLITLWSTWFYNFSSRTLLSPILPIIERELELSHGGAGSIFSFYAVGYTLSLLLAGPLIRWFGTRRVLIFGHTGVFLLICLFSFGRSYNFFVFVYLLVGLAAGVYLPCGISLLAEEFSSHNRAKVIGIHQTASSISFLIMPLLVGLLLNVSSWRSIVLLFSALGIPVFLALIKCVRTSPPATLPAKMDYSSLLRDKRIWVLAILGGITSSCNIGIYAIVPLFLVSERGFSVLAANQLLGMSRIGGVLAPFIVGVLADRFGYISTLLPVMVLFGLFTILITIGQTESSVVIFLLVQASATAGFWPLSYALVTRMIDSANRGPAVVIVTIFGLASGMGLTPWLLGTVADHYSFSYGIITLGAIAMISPLLLRVFR